MNAERRVNATEVRASGGADELRVSGYAATYGTLSSLLPGGFKERIAHRAFDKILSTRPDTVCLLNHDSNHVLGRTTSGTLTLEGDDKGLRFSCLLPNTQAGRDTHISVQRGDLSGCSFAFHLDEQRGATWDEEIDEEEDDDLRGKGKRSKVVVRTVRDFKNLLDVSICASPAYGNTSVAARMNVVPAEIRSHAAAFHGSTKTTFFVSKDGRYKRSAAELGARAKAAFTEQEEADARILMPRRRALLLF